MQYSNKGYSSDMLNLETAILAGKSFIQFGFLFSGELGILILTIHILRFLSIETYGTYQNTVKIASLKIIYHKSSENGDH